MNVVPNRHTRRTLTGYRFRQGTGTELVPFLQQVTRLLSVGIRKKAKRHGVSYSFVFMRANGEQLRQITSLIESAVIRPVIDRTFPFDATKEALAYLDTGRARGKVVVKVR